MSSELLVCTDVEVTYPSKGFGKAGHKVLKGVSLDVRRGETVGLVGESGSGKSTLGRGILGLAPVTAGSIRFEGKEISQASRAERKELSRDIQVVFQDPYTSLNPAMTIGQILAEPLSCVPRSPRSRPVRVVELLDDVQLPANAAMCRPREVRRRTTPAWWRSPAPWR